MLSFIANILILVGTSENSFKYIAIYKNHAYNLSLQDYK